MAFLTSQDGCVVPRHQHDSEQFSYCISGALQFKIGGEEMILRGRRVGGDSIERSARGRRD
jgi:hypothetical protein